MTNENWASARIWLQREAGDEGSHTWCEDSIGDDIEEAEYVRVDAAPKADTPVDAGGRDEREAFEAWAKGRYSTRYIGTYMERTADAYERTKLAEAAWDAWQARAALQPSEAEPAYSAPFTTDVPHCCGDPATCNDPCDASPRRASLTNYVTDLNERLIAAIEGECDGLAITDEQASSILAYLQYGVDLDCPATLCI